MSSTFTDYVEDWLTIKAASVRPRTLEQYAGIARAIVQAIGDRPLDALTPATCAAVYAPAVAMGHARSAQLVYNILDMMLRDAVEMRLLTSSPMTALRRPRYDPREINPFLADEAAALQIDPDHGFVWRLLAGTGLRRGEACALRWTDVDLRGRSIRVERQLVRASGRIYEAPPKSSAGIRTIPISAALVEDLRAHLLNQILTRRVSDYVISCDGTRVEPRTVNRWLTAAAVRAGVADAHPHRWRHTYGADAVSAGVDIRVLQRLLGHSNISVTARYYAYVRPDVLRSAADLIAAYQAR